MSLQDSITDAESSRLDWNWESCANGNVHWSRRFYVHVRTCAGARAGVWRARGAARAQTALRRLLAGRAAAVPCAK